MSVDVSEFGNRGPVILPGLQQSPGVGRDFYVHHNAPGAFSDLPDSIVKNLRSAIHEAVALVESGRGDRIHLLSGHTENIASATYLTTTTATLPTYFSIIGPSHGKAATLTWSTATSQLALSSAGIRIDGGRSDGYGIKFELAGDPTSSTAITVAAPVSISAAHCGFVRCDMGVGVDNDQLITIGFTTTAAADQFTFAHNRARGAAAATMTTLVRLVGLDDARIYNNDIVCGTSAAAVGPIQALTTAPVNAVIARNYIHNNATSSTACITGMAAMTGVIAYNLLRNMTDGSNAQIATVGNTQAYENYGVNDNGERGIILGTASV